MNYDTVNYQVKGNIGWISLNRPDCLNAMNRKLIDETTQAFEQANRDDQIKVIIFSGEGRAFCAGDDRREHQHPQSKTEANEFVDAIQRVTHTIVRGEKLVVGAIHGWAVGGGFEWALNCDFSIWARGAKAFIPEVSLNLLVTGGITTLLPAMVGLNRAREMLMLGEHFDANSLKEMGIAWRVVDDDSLLEEASLLADRLSKLPEFSSRAMKRVLNQTAMQSLEQAMKLETEATVEGFMDPQTTQLLQKF